MALTLYVFVVVCPGIQQYLFENNRIDNIFTDFYYDRFTDCLNEILSTYQVSLNSQGVFCHRETSFFDYSRHCFVRVRQRSFNNV